MSDEQQILQKLQAYSDEIYGERGRLSGKLTIDELIDSHRHLREQYGRYLTEHNAIVADARKIGIRQGRESITDQYILKDRLKAMTIQELVELLTD